jgi:hypothetical protein
MVNRSLPKPSSSNKQIREYTDAVKKGVNSQFIIHMSNGWSLRPATKPEKAVLFDSKELALKKAKQNAKPKSDIYIFSQSGSLIAEVRS